MFGDIGYEGTLIKDIAERAGISSGTIYTYFKDKKDLFRATVQEGWNRFLAQIRELAEAGEPAEERLQQFIEIGFAPQALPAPPARHALRVQPDEPPAGKPRAALRARRAARRRGAEGAGAPPVGPGQRRSLIRVTVVGVLFSAALAEPSRVDAEIDGLKRMITSCCRGDESCGFSPCARCWSSCVPRAAWASRCPPRRQSARAHPRPGVRS